METEEQASRAIECMNGREIGGRPIRTDRAQGRNWRLEFFKRKNFIQILLS